MIKLNKIPANALFIVVVMSLLIGLICTALFMFYFFYNQRVKKDIVFRRIELNLESAITYLLNESVPSDTTLTLDLYSNGEDSVNIVNTHWGILEASFIKSFTGNQQVHSSFLYGYLPDQTNLTALYVTSRGRTVTISGNTCLRGKCYVPDAEIKRGNAEGYYFTGEKPSEKFLTKSNIDLPPVNQKILRQIIHRFDKGSVNTSEKVFYSIEQDTLIHSFSDTLLVVHSTGVLRLENKKIQGHILIQSDKEIFVSASAVLNDIILIAPSITIEDNFKGNIQAYATDSLKTGKNCIFSYPTVLGVIKKDFTIRKPVIRIGTSNSVEGFIFSYCNVADMDKTLITVGEFSEIQGMIYADGFLELKPKVRLKGQAYANQLYLKTSSSSYNNNLLDVTIDRMSLSPHFIGTSLFPASSKKGIIKYLR